MFRHFIVLTLTVMLMVGVATAGELPWLDMENCAMCKSLSSNPELMANIQWGQYDISNGIVAVTNVNEKYLDTYYKAHAEMEKVGQRLMAGEQLNLCGSCTALGMCMMKGATPEYVKTATGDLFLVTSDNPDIITELHSWAKRNKEEMAKLRKS